MGSKALVQLWAQLAGMLGVIHAAAWSGWDDELRQRVVHAQALLSLCRPLDFVSMCRVQRVLSEMRRRAQPEWEVGCRAAEATARSLVVLMIALSLPIDGRHALIEALRQACEGQRMDNDELSRYMNTCRTVAPLMPPEVRRRIWAGYKPRPAPVGSGA